MKVTKKNLEKLVKEVIHEHFGFGASKRLTLADVQAELARLDYGQAMKFLKKNDFEEVPMPGISNVRLYKRSNKLYSIKIVNIPSTGKSRLQLVPVDEVPDLDF